MNGRRRSFLFVCLRFWLKNRILCSPLLSVSSTSSLLIACKFSLNRLINVCTPLSRRPILPIVNSGLFTRSQKCTVCASSMFFDVFLLRACLWSKRTIWCWTINTKPECRSALLTTIHRKAFNLSSKGGRDFAGEIVNMTAADTERIVDYIPTLNRAWAVCIQILVGLYSQSIRTAISNQF